MPAATPVTTPVAAPTVATDGLRLIQVPPGNELARVTVLPAHIGVLPVLGPGNGLTLTTVVTIPHGLEKLISAVPAERPVTIPVTGVMLATAGAVLDQKPGAALVSVMLLPTQSGALPITALTNGVTVTVTCVAPQPVTYDTVAVPIPAPVSSPEDVIVAIEDGAHVHVPPGAELPRRILLPVHTGALPLIAPGRAFTVSTAYTAPQPVV